MPTERINTHQLKADGCSDELGKHLQQIVDTLRQLTGVEATQRWQVALNDDADTAIY